MQDIHWGRPSHVAGFRLFLTPPFDCGYLSGRSARSELVLPEKSLDLSSYSRFISHGFRRNGHYVYRPRCEHCQACVPVRILTATFAPVRSQRRCQQRHAGLKVSEVSPAFSAEQHALYVRYQQARHPGGGMDDDDPKNFEDFILNSPVDTRILEFRDGHHAVAPLRMVSVIDILEDGLSSVYTFFDPEVSGLGIYNILWQIEAARRLGLPHVYLGYYIAECRKMNYKIRFQPLEGWINHSWQALEPMAQ